MVERMSTSSTGGQKGVKLARFDLIPFDQIWELAELYGSNGGKYPENNWRKGYDFSKSFAALNRHLWLWWNGENCDKETGAHHLMCVVWHAFTLHFFEGRFPMFDDRVKETKNAD